ncbi:MAG: enolase C-terminal domain-like protein, partial [Pseudomonadota bacterium]
GIEPSEVRPLAKSLAEEGYTLLEQPLPPEKEAFLKEFSSPLPLCADESLQTHQDVDKIKSIYQYGNIKLDKCGGLTAGLHLKEKLQAAGLKVFIGTMLGGTRMIAPAFLLGQDASFVDLDGPLLLAEDSYTLSLTKDGKLPPPPFSVWGG